jgi:hypothetical protein
MINVPAKASIISFTSAINGAQANEGAGSGRLATGSASIFFDDMINVFSWDISWVDSLGPAVAAHFHGPAMPNQNAGVQVHFLSLAPGNPSTGNTIINTAQFADLLAGLWYINIHTAVKPGGEIRGQVFVVPSPIPVPEPNTLALLGSRPSWINLRSTQESIAISDDIKPHLGGCFCAIKT